MKNWVLYIVILAVGIAVGLGSRVLVPSDTPASSASAVTGNSADDRLGSDSTNQSAIDWCSEHRVPESQCTQCNSELIAEFKAKNDWCGEHGLPESHCRLCDPEIHFPQEPPEVVTMGEPIRSTVFYPANVVDCATNNAIIQFATAETSTRAGLSVEQVLDASGNAFVEAPAEIRFDDTKTTTLTVTVDALLARWFVEPGDHIFAGQKLAELESPEVARLQAEYLEASAMQTVAVQQLARAKSLRESDLLSQAEYEGTEAETRAAEARFAGVHGLLLTAGFSDADCDVLLESKEVSQRYTLRAPSTGLLVERRAPVGELLDAGSPLALIGDPSEVWIEAQVRERELADIRVGQSIEFSVDGSAIERVAGKVIWVAQFLDQQTRTGTVRAKLLSAHRAIKANLFGRAKIYTDDNSALAVVSHDAVQWEGCCNVVFVQEAVDRYRPRKVNVARGDNDHYRILSGVVPGEMIVVNGSYLLKTELKKGLIGAGCCDVGTN
jgi:cobalt-zinc-cadmium efflux system membrane fusion protein